MKKVFAILLAALMLLSVVGCAEKTPSTPAATKAPDKPAEQGKVFNIYAWNEEFKGFFEKYYTIPEGVTVNWIINPSDNGVYQQKLDEALRNQDKASADEKIDLFLAEADYIGKYVNSNYTMDVTSFGFQNAPTQYEYTIKAASDDNGVCKGVSFQCCPAAVIYRKSIAMDILGTDDPVEVQAAMDNWEKFDALAAKAKEKGYYMTASFAETFRAFSNNCTKPWVDADNNLQFDPQITAWMDQTENYIKNGYTLTAGIWDTEKTNEMFKAGKTFCFFGPAWYYNFCMNNAMDPENGCVGDWRIVKGPQAYFWGGTWLLAATGSDNTDMLKEIFETFTVNEDVCSKLVSEQNQFPNNTKVVEKFAQDSSYGNTAILDGQNDIAIFAELAKDIKWENHTNYDQLLNEGLQNKLQEFYNGSVDKETAMKNFYNYVKETYANINVPEA
ncbi:MAG: carbohydrate ABC transporter substrate-binding protein [Oscillospiraceae bacterium]|nr:carbohydrate ABC transporter substrate-binding protein [Oscillospiraceae bacterium]